MFVCKILKVSFERFDLFFRVCCVYRAMSSVLFIFKIYLKAFLVTEWHVGSNSSEEWTGRIWEEGLWLIWGTVPVFFYTDWEEPHRTSLMISTPRDSNWPLPERKSEVLPILQYIIRIILVSISSYKRIFNEGVICKDITLHHIHTFSLEVYV